ncbi:MAG: hypothetical protein WAS21_27960 [Geminicoccaceae bacterium]
MPDEPNPAPSATNAEATAPFPFVALGYDLGRYAVRRATDGREWLLTPGNLTRKELLWLAPERWWYDRCPGDGSQLVDWNAARDLVMDACHRAGRYLPDTDETPEVNPPHRFTWRDAGAHALRVPGSEVTKEHDLHVNLHCVTGSIYLNSTDLDKRYPPWDGRPPEFPNLDRARLRAALLSIAAHEERQWHCLVLSFPPPLKALQADAESLERRWTLSGRLTPCEALILIGAFEKANALDNAGAGEIEAMAVWLGLLPAAAPPAEGDRPEVT